MDEERTPNYSWRPSTEILVGGYPGEGVGVIPANPAWATSTAKTGTGYFSCYYHDSSTVQKDCVSTQVTVDGYDAWTIDVEPDNSLLVKVATVITSIVRGNKREECGTLPPRLPDGTWDFIIKLSRSQTSPTLWTSSPLYIGEEKTILTNFNLGSYTYRIPPGGGASQYSLYLRNDNAKYAGNPDPKYHDIFQMGIEFRNNLPAIYRPGQLWNGSEWLSHNRSTGTRKIWAGAGWKVLETYDGPAGSNAPPTIWDGSRNQNMRRIGKE